MMTNFHPSLVHPFGVIRFSIRFAILLLGTKLPSPFFVSVSREPLSKQRQRRTDLSSNSLG